MAAKEVKFSTDARTKMLKGVEILEQRGEGHARPQGPQRRARQELRRAADHQGRGDGRQGDRALRQVREHGRADGARGGLARPATSPATAPPRRPSWPPRSCARAAKSVAAGMNPMDLKRGIDLAVEAVVKDLEGRSKKVTTSEEIAQVGTISSQRRRRDRQDAGRGDAEGRQRGRDHGRGGEEPGDRARRGRGHAVRPRLHLALLHHQRREDAGRARGALHPDPREEAVLARRRSSPCSSPWSRAASRC